MTTTTLIETTTRRVYPGRYRVTTVGVHNRAADVVQQHNGWNVYLNDLSDHTWLDSLGAFRTMREAIHEARWALARAVDNAGRTWQQGARAQRDADGEIIVDTVMCGQCGRTWNDALITSRTPAPSARCPFEDEHVYPLDGE